MKHMLSSESRGKWGLEREDTQKGGLMLVQTGLI